MSSGNGHCRRDHDSQDKAVSYADSQDAVIRRSKEGIMISGYQDGGESRCSIASAEEQGGVDSAEAERVTEEVIGCYVSTDARYVVQIAHGIRRIQVHGWRQPGTLAG